VSCVISHHVINIASFQLPLNLWTPRICLTATNRRQSPSNILSWYYNYSQCRFFSKKTVQNVNLLLHFVLTTLTWHQRLIQQNQLRYKLLTYISS